MDNLRATSRMGRQCGPPGWRGELHQARDPATARAEVTRQGRWGRV